MVDLNKIGFGTYRLKDKKTTILYIKQALQLGYRTIDTAVLYENHEYIAHAIQESNINRRDLFIISKIHNNDQIAGKIRESYSGIIKYFDGYVDLLLLHSPVKNKFIESWKILEQLYLEKKVRYIGVSNFRIHELEQILSICQIKPFLNQIEISPFCTRKELTDFCFKNNILIQAYGSLTNTKKINDQKLQDIKNCISSDLGIDLSAAQILLKWALQKNYYIIPKSTNIIHMQENLCAADIKNFNNAHMRSLDLLNESFHTIPHFKDICDVIVCKDLKNTFKKGTKKIK